VFLGSLEAVSRLIDRPPAEETIQALTGALRYFAQAAPKHTADEEQSLFPRLRQNNSLEVESAFAKLDKLEDDHRWAAPLHAKVDELGEQYLSTGSLSDGEVEQFRISVANLAVMYRQHIAIEDDLIFPLAARILSPSEKAIIAQEMADRRNVPRVAELAERKP
jgi:hemerythrin-like domain-containing protein